MSGKTVPRSEPTGRHIGCDDQKKEKAMISISVLFSDVFSKCEDLIEQLKQNGTVEYNGYLFTEEDIDVLSTVLLE